MDMNYRDLEKVRVIIKDATDLDVTYAYEDMVFPDHTAFIIQFDDNNLNNLFCYFHEDCKGEDQDKLFKSLMSVCKESKVTLDNKGAFKLEQNGEKVEIHFI